MLPPIKYIFELLREHATVSIWLYEQLSIRIEGKIRGFDEFMNLVIDEAVEVKQVTKTNEKETRRPLGRQRLINPKRLEMNNLVAEPGLGVGGNKSEYPNPPGPIDGQRGTF
ncbi:LSM domain, eukaryotic/archaea-type [Fusarium oxysporum f. sp. vasinfectum]|nr:LSM domain, eukaryotic/archaea-type [Fusarium oxysporum f. sp. vasinfectum]WKT44401.1 LSM domain, eukaryotic/archaea-type [Fusarium oxysporum f. sp. vasinfectum]